jgi:hypothetical protein
VGLVVIKSLIFQMKKQTSGDFDLPKVTKLGKRQKVDAKPGPLDHF